MGERGRGAIVMGAGQGWAGLNARVSVGHSPFWEPAQPPPGAPAGCRDTWSVQDRSICPTTSVPLMPAPRYHLLHRHLMEMTYCCLT